MLEKIIIHLSLLAAVISLILLDMHYFRRKRGTEATKATQMAATAYRYNEISEIVYRHLHALVLLSAPYMTALILYLCNKAGVMKLSTSCMVILILIAPVTLACLYLHIKHSFAFSATRSTEYDSESFLERISLTYAIDKIIIPTYIQLLYAAFITTSIVNIIYAVIDSTSGTS